MAFLTDYLPAAETGRPRHRDSRFAKIASEYKGCPHVWSDMNPVQLKAVLHAGRADARYCEHDGVRLAVQV
jgi:hypothetical protein